MGEECEDAAEEGKGKEQTKEQSKEPGEGESKTQNKEPTPAVQPGTLPPLHYAFSHVNRDFVNSQK